MIEMMITIGIATAVVAAIGAFQSDVFSYSSILDASFTNQQGARKILRPFASEVRSATISDIGGFPIETAGSYSLSFFTNVDGDDLREQVTYELVGSTLKKTIVKPTGNPLQYNEANAEEILLVTDIISTEPIFEYFDETYDGTASSTALVQPVTPADIKLIKVSIVIDSDPNKSPPPFEVTTQVAIRNLKISL